MYGHNGIKQREHLDEGIRDMKSKDYCELRGIGEWNRSGYGEYTLCAEQLGRIIGRDNLIQKDFYSDIEGVRQDVQDITIGSMDFDSFAELLDQLENQYSDDYFAFHPDSMGPNMPVEISQESIDDYFAFHPDSMGPNMPVEIRQESIDKYNGLQRYKQTKEQLQQMLDKGFIASRCSALEGREYNEQYYTDLSKKQLKSELQAMKDFRGLAITRETSLDIHIQNMEQQLSRQSLFSRVKNFFKREQPLALPEGILEQNLEEQHAGEQVTQNLGAQGLRTHYQIDHEKALANARTNQEPERTNDDLGIDH